MNKQRKLAPSRGLTSQYTASLKSAVPKWLSTPELLSIGGD